MRKGGWIRGGSERVCEWLRERVGKWLSERVCVRGGSRGCVRDRSITCIIRQSDVIRVGMTTSEIFALSLATCASLAATSWATRDKGFLEASLLFSLFTATAFVSLGILGTITGVILGAGAGAGVGVASGGGSRSLVASSTGIPTSAVSVGRLRGC